MPGLDEEEDFSEESPEGDDDIGEFAEADSEDS